MALKSLPRTVLYFIILLTILWGRELFFNFTQYDSSILSTKHIFSGYSSVSYQILDFFHKFNLWSLPLLILVILINALFITKILLKYLSYLKYTFIPVIIYGSLVSIMIIDKENHVNQIITFALLYFFEKQVFTKRNYNYTSNTFLAGVYLGIAALLAPIYYSFWIVIITSQIISLRVSFKTITSSLFGLITPLFLYSYTTWVTGGEFLELPNSVIAFYQESFLRVSFNIHSFNVYDYFSMAIISILCIIGVKVFIQYTISNNTKFDYLYYLILIMLLTTLIISILFYSSLTTLIPLIGICATIIISTLIIQTTQKKLQIIIFTTIILVSIFANYYKLIFML